jgi:hypothetical protein
MYRALMVALLATAALAIPALAVPSPVRLDRSHGVRFSLTGSVLTVRLVPQRNRTPPDARKQLWGKRIGASCSPTFQVRDPRRSIVRAVRFWPRGQLELSYSFRQDISDRVKWCLLEDGGRDVAAVDFEVFIRVYGGSAGDRRVGQELRRYLLRNAGSQAWLTRVRAIVVDRGVIAVATELRRDRRGKRIARRLCRLIQGADVADFTPGHTILGHEDVVLRTCRSRRQARRASTLRG